MAITRTLIMNPTLVKELTQIDSNVDQKMLTNNIVKAQELYIRPILGSRLYAKILTDIDGDTLSGNYQTLVDNYVIPCLKEYICYVCAPEMVFKWRNKNIGTQGGDNNSAITKEELDAIREMYKNDGEMYAKFLTDFIHENIANYPEYSQNSGIDEYPPKQENFTTNIYLGNGKEDYCKGYFS
jgi:hypothetical protein